MTDSKVSAQQRMINFNKMTRKYLQTLPSMTFAENQTVSVQLPKTRFLSKIFLRVSGTFKTAHATKTDFTESVFGKYNLLKQIRLSINNGFNPYSVSGSMLSLYNKVNNYKNINLATDTFNVELLEKVVSVAGTTNDVNFYVDVPVTINDRDLIGMILLQNDQTVVTLSVDCGEIADIMTDSDITVSNVAITITPIIETYSIPTVPDAVPDFSVLKLVTEQIEYLSNSGEQIIKLPTSLTYRKMLLYFESDADGTAITADKLDSIQLVFNQADTPVNIPIDFLARQNKQDYQGGLPAGAYVLDLSGQGIPNLGSARDYIDTERLTEFWIKVRFNTLTGTTNNVKVVAEKLARLI